MSSIKDDDVRALTDEEKNQAAFLVQRCLVILGTGTESTAVLAVSVGAIAGRLVTTMAKMGSIPVGEVAEAVLKQIVLGIEQAARVEG